MDADMTHDEFHGHGGSYIIDPDSGKRKLVHRTRNPGDAIADERVLGTAVQAPAAGVVEISKNRSKKAS